MASYHCTVKAGGKGRAGKHADYIEREGQYAPELAQGKSKLEDLEHKASGNMPAWAKHEAGIFWKAADEHERANGSTYREIEIALPRELSPKQRIALVEDFIQQQIGDRHPFTYAIHIPKAAIEKGEQPHCHFMYSERTLDGIDRDPDQFFKRANSKNPEKGGCKKDSAGTQERLLATRELWAKVQNTHLEKAGFDERVSHLSLKAQGIERQPEKHLGPADAKKINAPALVESRAAERELTQARAELLKINVPAELTEAHAINTQLTVEKEKQNDRIRNTALDRIGNNLAAASQSIAIATAASRATDKAIEASRGHLNDSIRNANSNHRNSGRALDGAEQRNLAENLDRCAPAVREQLGGVNYVLQQLVEYLPRVVKAIATRLLEELITQRVADRKAKETPALALEQPQQAAPAQAKAIHAATQERPPEHPVRAEIDAIPLTRSGDLELAQRAKNIYAAQSDPESRRLLSISINNAIIEAQAAARKAAPKTNERLIEQEVKNEYNRAAVRAGEKEPWPVDRSQCALIVPAIQAHHKLADHNKTQRPMLFGRREWDDTKDELQRHKQACDAAVERENERLARDVAKLVDAARALDAQNAPVEQQARLRIESLKSLEKITDRERKRATSKETQIKRSMPGYKPEKSRGPERGGGHGR